MGFKEYWESDLYGKVPRFPVIKYDRSVPEEFILYFKTQTFYNEFLFDDFTWEDIILIDSNGDIFDLMYHENNFRYPLYSGFKIERKELIEILVKCDLENLEVYKNIESVRDIIKELFIRKEEHGNY